jgi:nuclear receptor subfamily 1 group I
MICVICGNRAIGYNYDVLSCASCKAFFRRNADRNLVCCLLRVLFFEMTRIFQEKMRCLTDGGQCSVAYGTRRKCQKCRLERSFTAGMRKDFFRSEEENQRRKGKFLENRTLTLQSSSTSTSINSSSIVQSASNSESLSSTSDEIDRVWFSFFYIRFIFLVFYF